MAERVFIKKSNIEGIEDEVIALDAVVEESHSLTARVTSNPIELGADVNDHVILEPTKIVIRGAVTDSPLGFAALSTIVDNINGLFGSSTSENLTRSQQAFQLIIDLWEEREPIEVQTGLKKYSDMIITNINSSQDKDTSKIAIMDITLQNVVVVESQVVILKSDNLDEEVKEKAEEEVSEGRKEASQVTGSENTSVLKSITNFVGDLF